MKAKFPIKVVYVSGAISNKNPKKVEANINIALAFGAKIYHMGYIPLIPHAYLEIPEQQAWFGGLGMYDFMLMDLEFINRSDAVFMLPNYKSSLGAMIELAWAIKEKKPIFYNLKEIREWEKIEKKIQAKTILDKMIEKSDDKERCWYE